MSISVTKRSSSVGKRRRTSRRKSASGSITLDEDTRRDSISVTIETDEIKINYQDELVMVFFNSMLDIIIEKWEEQSDESAFCICRKSVNTDLGSTVQIESCNSLKRNSKNDSSTSTKSAKRDSTKRKLSKISEAPKSSDQLNTERSKGSIRISKSSLKNSRASTATDTIEVTTFLDWMLNPPNENAKIVFKNGDRYEGPIVNKVMHGHGKYTWADGTIYEGDFVNGFATGYGTLQYPDLTVYYGEFLMSLLHGYGVININATTLRYSGNWKAGKKHGKGWLLYESDDWYDGEWFEDQRQGMGLRSYKMGERYQGDWHNGQQNGNGIFIWANKDLYNGEWINGKMHGYGEYTWNAFLNKSFTFVVENIYKGSWIDGRRHGAGMLDFGFNNGARLNGIWMDNKKHGPGTFTCGNGSIIQQTPLFLNDKTVGIQSESTSTNASPLNTKPSEASSTRQISSSLKKNQITLSSLNTDSSSISVIPLHLSPENTDFSFYLNFVVQTYTEELYREQFHHNESDVRINACAQGIAPNMNVCDKHKLNRNRLELNESLDVIQLQQYEVEKVCLRDTITMNLPKLHKLYNQYATITVQEKINFKPTLVRYFLWQMIRDLNYLGSNYSLVGIDLILQTNPNSGLEFQHDPFEKIYFWQFLQLLVCLALNFHSPATITEECKNSGILATILNRFLTDEVFPYLQFTQSYSLFEYRDLLPIKSVYRLYKTIGEPHTARTFLNSVCVIKGENPPCHLPLWEEEEEEMFVRTKGVNAVPVGGNLFYLEGETTKFGKPALAPDENSPVDDSFKKQLYVLRSLGAKRVVKCLISACPKICSNEIIVNMEYPLTFIEFYDALIMCSFAFIERKKKIELMLKLVEENKQLQATSKEVDYELDSSKHRRSNTRVRKSSKK